MPNDQNPQHRRPNYHRGRRGGDRRGPERRSVPHQEPGGRDTNVDVEQIMRDIRARISQRHGIDLTPQQIQELAARRLEAILEPRHVKPALLEQLRRGAAEPEPVPSPPQPAYEFEDSTIYDTHRGFLRFMRKLLNPILLLFFNPATITSALHTQAQVNQDAAAREAEAVRRQSEWNALHYELLQRLVTEVSRVSIEMQSLALRVESLAAKVEFNEKRVRGIENTVHVARPAAPRPIEPAASPAVATGSEFQPSAAPAESPGAEGPRRKRRRRRGRRGAGALGDVTAAGVAATAAAVDTDEGEGDAGDAGDLGEGEDDLTMPMTAGTEEAVPIDSSIVVPEPRPDPLAPIESPEPRAFEEPVSERHPEPPIQPAPARDEPAPPPVDHVDPGPPDR